jgi:enoyl-CoA hydratase
MSEQPDATITEQDGIITVTFDRQSKLNAINTQMSDALWEAANALADRDDLRCMVITAKGPYFTAGIDLMTTVGNRPGNPETEHLHPGWNFRRNYRSHHLLYDEFESIEKPIILAAQGTASGPAWKWRPHATFASVLQRQSSVSRKFTSGSSPEAGGRVA